MNFPAELTQNPEDAPHWDTQSVHTLLEREGSVENLRATERFLEKVAWLPTPLDLEDLRDEDDMPLVGLVAESLLERARRKRLPSYFVQQVTTPHGTLLFANDGRHARRWRFVDGDLTPQALLEALDALVPSKGAFLWPHGAAVGAFRELQRLQGTHAFALPGGAPVTLALTAYRTPLAGAQVRVAAPAQDTGPLAVAELTHLDRLEAESIHIMREVAAQAENPVMLYSVGKDSSVMLHLARKAFYPSPPPFPLMHVDTRWKFRAMYDFREQMAREVGMDLIVHINPDGVAKDMNPFDHGSAIHTDVMKTQGLKQALDKYEFDVAFGGARRDEEKSRAKERVFSFRTETHTWDPKNQRPELWNLYNGYKHKGESIRVFPLSNWTELDIWQYIYREGIPIVPLYFAAERPVVERDGMLMMVDDDRMRMLPGEEIETRRVRFRTLGCYPLTGAIDSDADSLSAIVLELLKSRTSERQGRAIDSDSNASMEKKKREGYF